MARRIVQAVCLAAFLVLAGAGFAGVWLWAAGLFLRLDPVVAAGTALAGRTLAWGMLPAAGVLVLTPVLGRFFCGWICPMGTSIDMADRLLSGRRRRLRRARGRPNTPGPWTGAKYLILAGMAGSALTGVSLAFWASPIPLVTRFYALLAGPVLTRAGEWGLAAVRPLAENLDATWLMFAELRTPSYAAWVFVLALFLAVFSAGLLVPRLWCRSLCPAGGLFALLSRRPVVRRRVDDACIDCGRCQRICPTGAIGTASEDPGSTDFGECLNCRRCAEVCPVSAIGYAPARPRQDLESKPVHDPDRRRLLTAGAAGMVVAGLSAVPGPRPLREALLGPGPEAMLVRPPGALPEPEFLARCVRCGACMNACPTNTLQPVWLSAGLDGAFSPVIRPRSGPCDPRCHNCAKVCPTNAMHAPGARQRIWARTGTAIIEKGICLAHEGKKKCLVCDEVCPFDAVTFAPKPGHPVPVPEVDADKCAGCGYCEHHCPVQGKAAIRVGGRGALRLEHADYRARARKKGWELKLRPEGWTTTPTTPTDIPRDDDSGLPPGFDPAPDSGDSGPPPGFDPKPGDTSKK